MIRNLFANRVLELSPELIFIVFLAILLGSVLVAPPALAAAPIEAPPKVDQHCELLQSDDLVQPGPLVGQDLNIPEPSERGEAQLVIECIVFDRTHYLESMQFHAEILVTNIGDGVSDPFSIHSYLCRYMENGTTFACQGNSGSSWLLADNEPGLDPHESRIIISPSHHFGPLPNDSYSPETEIGYESWVDGVLDNGIVYLNATFGGVEDFFVAQAIYPSGPSNPAASLPGFVDKDGDGHPPQPDNR